MASATIDRPGSTLGELLGSTSLGQTAALRRRQMAHGLARSWLPGEAHWTEAVAVDSQAYLEWAPASVALPGVGR